MQKRIYLIAAGLGSLLAPAYSGNPDRAGQAGAGELLINPWARSSGWAGANAASVRGLEASYLNIAGTAFTKKTEILFSQTNWLQGSGIRINSFGLTQRVGEESVIGGAISSMGFGEIPVTTTDLPEGGIGTFSPQFMNMSLFYSKAFSNSIYGGINFKTIYESIYNVNALGVGVDAGIQYVTGIGLNKEGKKNTDNLKFGISLKNVGPPIRYHGDGFAKSMPNTTSFNEFSTTMEQRSERFELPSLVNVGGAYDYKISDIHRLTAALNFTSNSFTNNQYQFGVEYGFKTYLMVRAGYLYEPDRSTVLTGPAGGVSFEFPLGKLSERTFAVDYSFRATEAFGGVHSIGARINL